jgi:hypothetical protein
LEARKKEEKRLEKLEEERLERIDKEKKGVKKYRKFGCHMIYQMIS